MLSTSGRVSYPRKDRKKDQICTILGQWKKEDRMVTMCSLLNPKKKKGYVMTVSCYSEKSICSLISFVKEGHPVMLILWDAGKNREKWCKGRLVWKTTLILVWLSHRPVKENTKLWDMRQPVFFLPLCALCLLFSFCVCKIDSLTSLFFSVGSSELSFGPELFF